MIVDDEPLARRNIAILLQSDPEIAGVSECGSGQAAVDAVRRAPPDLMFIDVQMPEVDGFDVLELLGGQAPRAVVFVTAYDEYALRAFEAGALDYLLKPYDDARFRRTLDRAKLRISEAGPPPRPSVERLVVKSRGRAIFVDVRDLDWIEAASYYACLHVGADTHILRRTLAELEQDLDPDRFIRIHRSAIVRLDRVEGLQLTRSGDHEAVLADGTRLRVSRRYRKLLQDRLISVSQDRAAPFA
ncbi:MAG: response regulator transcription factor [Phenylobacterium sp.]|nr:MAG: response regulator transcription factor [Phenylobacterium sp.]